MGKTKSAYVHPDDVRWGSETKEEALEVVRRYLPSNYTAELQSVETFSEKIIVISGEDSAGWTLGDYVIPRMASGGIWAKLFRRSSSQVCRICVKREGEGLISGSNEKCMDCGAAIDFMDDDLFDRLVENGTGA